MDQTLSVVDSLLSFIPVAEALEAAGLVWFPEIGDEITSRGVGEDTKVSILVDPQGMTPAELRRQFLWLPSVEQIIYQVSARQGFLLHAGLELSAKKICYKTVIQVPAGLIECESESLRTALGQGLRDLMIFSKADGNLH